ncbi:MAG: hypothetical protein ABFQ64_10385 [Campylobacterota bacterium]
MLNTRDLEERWLKYKIKSYIPHATIAVSLVIIIATVSIFFSSNEEKNIDSHKETETKKDLKQEVETATKVAKVTPVAEENTQVVKTQPKRVSNTAIETEKKNSFNSSYDTSLKLSPSLDFMKKMQHSSLPYYQNETPAEKVNSNSPVHTSQIVEEVQELDIEETTETVAIQEEPEKISIQRRDASDDIRHIIKRFKKNNNPTLSLFIAKKYYELGEYHKAYNYALITNEIDRDIDASWIVFAKSLVKLNQKEMAIKTLKQYMETSHSSSAKILLDEIVSGKFK